MPFEDQNLKLWRRGAPPPPTVGSKWVPSQRHISACASIQPLSALDPLPLPPSCFWAIRALGYPATVHPSPMHPDSLLRYWCYEITYMQWLFYTAQTNSVLTAVNYAWIECRCSLRDYSLAMLQSRHVSVVCNDNLNGSVWTDPSERIHYAEWKNKPSFSHWADVIEIRLISWLGSKHLIKHWYTVIMRHDGKWVGDWISAPSRNFVGPITFCIVPSIELAVPENPLVGRPKHLWSVCRTSRVIGDFVQK